MPSHEFVPTHVGESSEPVEAFEHIPRFPGTLQALQDPVQEESQQTPSTQMPLEHSVAIEQI